MAKRPDDQRPRSRSLSNDGADCRVSAMTSAHLPLQNRVLPTGEIVSDPARGTFTGNRGILPFDARKLGTSRWKHPHWIICTLTHPKGRYHGPQPTRGWTPLFFLDEAVGLAAGHRPCAYCRPKAYKSFVQAWQQATGERVLHKEMDRVLHAARVTRSREQIRHIHPLHELPTGAMIVWRDQPHLVLPKTLAPYAPHGYGPHLPRPQEEVTVLTPAPTIAVLRAGYRPKWHKTAES